MLPCVLPSHKNFLGDDELDHDRTPIIPPDPANIADADAEELAPDPADIAVADAEELAPDPADITDADAFEELAQNDQNFVTRAPDQSFINESQDIPDAPEGSPNDMEAGNAEAMPTVVIDVFPSASAGAPIDGMPHGNSVYESQQGVDGDSAWYPFTSQCDWLLARWAKMRGPTSSVVTELLAIPEVRTLLHSFFTLLILGRRL